MHRKRTPITTVRVWMLFCVVSAVGLASGKADEWPQWRGPTRDGVWREEGIVDRFENEKLAIRWRVPISSGYSGPTVAGGRVFVTDRLVRPRQAERVHCVDARSGELVWTHTYECIYEGVSYDAGPRAAVTIDDGRAYSLGAMGHLFCFAAADGEILWQKELNEQYKIRMPIWGITSAPLIEGNLIIVHIGGEGACLVAFDKSSGNEVWTALDDRANYSAPIVIEQAGKRVLVCWTGDNVVGLDPQTGRTHWVHSFPPRKMPLGIASPVVADNLLFLTGFYDGSLLLRLRQDTLGVEQVWRRRGESERNTDALHSIISTPYFDGDAIYGVDSYGELRCLDAATGDRVWENLDAVPKARWSTIHFVRNGERIWMFNERGELIISRLSRNGFEEISRAKLIDPTRVQLRQRDGVCWSHPAYAYRHVFQRSDEELVCASLAADPSDEPPSAGGGE